MQDFYFYEGKFHTEEGLKRALIKDGSVWVSRGTFYCYLPYSDEEIYYHFDYLRDILHDNGVINDEEYKHFRKWLNSKEKEGSLSVKRNCTWYHSEETDGMGVDWPECLEALRNGFLDIKTDEEIMEEYCDKALTDEQFKVFEKLPECRQFAIARKWKIERFRKD